MWCDTGAGAALSGSSTVIVGGLGLSVAFLLQAALTAVALGQLDQLKALPGGPQGLLDLIKECPIMAEVCVQHRGDKGLKA